jgi:transcription-repair coupling factor (superfamily II helicase)
MKAERVRVRPRGRLAIELIERWRDAGPRGLLFIGAGEREVEHLGANIYSLAPACPVMVLPSWDCLPYDPSGPSRDIMGRRMSVLRRLAGGIARPLVIATAEAVLQRVPPRSLWPGVVMRLRSGEALAVAELREFLQRVGYRLDTLVDEPGEAVLHGQVIDIFPAGALSPVRIEHEDGTITGLHSYDVLDQRRIDALHEVVLDAASEGLFHPTDDAGEDKQFSPWLCDAYPRLETIFDFLPDVSTVLDEGADTRTDLLFEQIAEAYQIGTHLPGAAGKPLPAPERLFLTEKEWRALCADTKAAPTPTGGKDVPLFAVTPNPTRAYRHFIAAAREGGDTIVFTGADPRDLKAMTRRAGIPFADAANSECWQDVVDAPVGSILTLQVDFDKGFRVPGARTTVIAAADLLGSRAGHQVPMVGTGRYGHALGESELRVGDAVVHLDHGIGLLRGIETIAAPEGSDQETVRLEYAGGATLLAPIAEIGTLWRYGGATEGVSLDRLGGEAWMRRRAEVEAEIRDTAIGLVAERKKRMARAAPKLSPPARDYERFVAGFPFVATVDQVRTADEILGDLVSGHPMDRLVCGDVGFGKTEIALRAAAAAALSGAQVAIVAPTTVLVRQHLGTFRRRFAALGIEVGNLSRLTSAGDAREIKKRLADGSLPIVVGTQAIAGKGVRFKRLGLLIIDEEQHFGSATKAQLRDFADGLHVLMLTATPIPRTLQRALVGVQSLSLLETPPARRQPVQTFLDAPRADLIRDALRFERRRGGQSFIVCPRIEDLAPLAEELRELLPELTVTSVHGKMPAAAIDEAMVGFADGAGDVLLTTNIIESGLDLPRANTILIRHPERFGVAQLHQLRGRVGRGRRRGFAYLLSEGKTGATAQKRLESVVEADRLGAGFDLSERDMDLRGAGDIVGEKQTGHVRVIGVELYRHLLARAVNETESARTASDYRPAVNLGVSASIPADYVADPELRLNLYSRLTRLTNAAAIDAFAVELEDRFGELPGEIQALIDLERIRDAVCHLGAERLDAGPQGIALSFTASRALARRRLGRATGVRWDGDRLIADTPTNTDDRARITLQLLAALADECGPMPRNSTFDAPVDASFTAAG